MEVEKVAWATMETDNKTEDREREEFKGAINIPMISRWDDAVGALGVNAK